MAKGIFPGKGLSCGVSDGCGAVITSVAEGGHSAWLVLMENDRPSRFFPLAAEGTLIGRDHQCDIPLGPPTCSRQHARIVLTNETWQIEDLNSRNGVLIDGKRCQGQAALVDGARLAFGPDACLVFVTSRERLDQMLPDPVREYHRRSTAIWVPEQKYPGVHLEDTIASEELEGRTLRKAQLDGMPLEDIYLLSNQLYQAALAESSNLVSDEQLAALMLAELARICCVERAAIFKVRRAGLGPPLANLGQLPTPEKLVLLAQDLARHVLTIYQGFFNSDSDTPREASEMTIVAPIEWDARIGKSDPPQWKRKLVGCVMLFGPHLTTFHADLAAMTTKLFATTWHRLHDRRKLHVQQVRERQNLTHVAWERGGVIYANASHSMVAAIEQATRTAPTNSRVVLIGETGVGKELFARQIHQLSPRRDNVFRPQNCATIPTGIMESQLFGHEKGAFTGADRRQIGLFEAAHEGTLFLDEIGELPLEAQAKLLRILQEGTLIRVGGQKPIKVDVRLIAATNRNLKQMIEAGQFREDLYYRLTVSVIQIPALRQRTMDIPLLLQYFSERLARNHNRPPLTFNKSATDYLQQYRWPGNIRELENFVERLVVDLPPNVSQVSKKLAAEYLSAEERPEAVASGSDVDYEFKESRALHDLCYAARTLQERSTRARAAKAMGISREGLTKMIRRHFGDFPRLADEPALKDLAADFYRGRRRRGSQDSPRQPR